jgi:hypothetical protein
MKRVINWLSKPYYFNPSAKFKFKLSFAFGLFLFLFLFFFKPFGLSRFEGALFEYSLGMGFLDFLGTFLLLIISPLIFKNYFSEDNWTVGRNILLMVVGLLFVALILWNFGEVYKKTYGFDKLTLLEFLSKAFLVGIIPLTFYVFINEKTVREKRERKIFKVKEVKKENKVNTPKEITINSDNEKEQITFDVDNLVYITSQGNYASFFLKKDDIITEKILRITLTKITEKLKDHPNIIRCHKSYIINSNFINDISGNARGYLLKSNYISEEIPVSRKFSKESLKVFLHE